MQTSTTKTIDTPEKFDQWVRQCRGKQKHRAIYQVLDVMKELKRKNPSDEYNWYICKYCSFLHVGHKLGTKKYTR
jgi:hypothetical protein